MLPLSRIVNLLFLFAALPLGAGCSSLTSRESWKWPFASKADEDESLLAQVDHEQNKPALSSAVAAVTKAPDASKARERFDKADELFKEATAAEGRERRRKFSKAAEAFSSAASAGKDLPMEEDSLFMAAESRFFADEYPRCVEIVDQLIKRYPRTRHIDRIDQRRFMIAQYWQSMADKRGLTLVPNLADKRRPHFDAFGHALKLYDRIRYDDPTGKLADDATMAAAVANFEAGRFVQANMLFDDLRESFASSEHQYQAHLLALKCKQKMYEGPDYDGQLLDDAESLIKQMYVQFPREIEPHREPVEQIAKDIRLKKAEREFALARYYDRRKEYRAARMAYTRVQEGFGDTNLALEAESRLAQLGGKPDMPEERLQWVADLFPREEEPKPLMANGPFGTTRR